MFKRLSLVSVLAALALTPTYASKPWENNNNDNNAARPKEKPSEYKSYATQMNLDLAGSRAVFQMGNDIYTAVQDLRTDFQVLDHNRRVTVRDDQGKILRDDRGVNVTKPYEKHFHLVCEQTTATPHATLAVVEPEVNASVSPATVKLMGASLDAQLKALQDNGCMFADGVHLNPKGLVLIAIFANEKQDNAFFMQDACPFAQAEPAKTNVYFRLNHNGELADNKGNLFKNETRDLLRSFIVLECSVMTPKGEVSGPKFLNTLEPVLEKGLAAQGLHRQKHTTPLLHVTLAKFANTKEVGRFKGKLTEAERDALKFPLANFLKNDKGVLVNTGAFAQLERLVVAAEKSRKANIGGQLLADKLVLNPASASNAPQGISPFYPNVKEDMRGRNDWNDSPRRSVDLVPGNDGRLPQGLPKLVEELSQLEKRVLEIEKELDRTKGWGKSNLFAGEYMETNRKIDELRKQISQMNDGKAPAAEKKQHAQPAPMDINNNNNDSAPKARVPGVYPAAFHADTYVNDFAHVRDEARTAGRELGTYAWEHFQKYKPHFAALNSPKYYSTEAAPKKVAGFDATRYLDKWTFVREEAIAKGIAPEVYALQHFMLNKKQFPNLANF